jgi:hypothetical protein
MDFVSGPSNGQVRRDTQIRHQNMVGLMLGASGNTFSKEEKNNKKVIVVDDIYIGEPEKNKTYTVLVELYPQFLQEVFESSQEIAWFLPSNSLNRESVYEVSVINLLQVMDKAWTFLYEWTMSAKDFSWFVDYNHHHSIIIYENHLADRAQNFLKRPRWVKLCYSCNFYPKGVKKTFL